MEQRFREVDVEKTLADLLGDASELSSAWSKKDLPVAEDLAGKIEKCTILLRSQLNNLKREGL